MCLCVYTSGVGWGRGTSGWDRPPPRHAQRPACKQPPLPLDPHPHPHLHPNPHPDPHPNPLRCQIEASPAVCNAAPRGVSLVGPGPPLVPVDPGLPFPQSAESLGRSAKQREVRTPPHPPPPHPTPPHHHPHPTHPTPPPHPTTHTDPQPARPTTDLRPAPSPSLSPSPCCALSCVSRAAVARRRWRELRCRAAAEAEAMREAGGRLRSSRRLSERRLRGGADGGRTPCR